MKHCGRCDTLKDESEFQRETANRDGLRNHCRACERIRQQEYYSRKADERREYAKRYGRYCREQRRSRLAQKVA